MKKVFLLFVCAATFAGSQAQVKFGAKAGSNFSTLSGDDADGAKMKVGVNVGVFAEVPLASSFSFRPEVVFSTQGAKSSVGSQNFKLNTSYINIPLIVKYTTTSGFFGETGPQVGILAAAKTKGIGESSDVKDAYKSTDFAWAFGLGYQLASGFGINGRYNLGLTKIADNDAKIKNSVFQLGVFYILGGGASAKK